VERTYLDPLAFNTALLVWFSRSLIWEIPSPYDAATHCTSSKGKKIETRQKESSGWQKFHLLKSLSRVLAIVPLPLANIFVMSGNFSRVCHDNCNCSPALSQLVSSWPATHLLFTLPKTIYLGITRNCRPHSMETCRKFINSPPATDHFNIFPQRSCKFAGAHVIYKNVDWNFRELRRMGGGFWGNSSEYR